MPYNNLQANITPAIQATLLNNINDMKVLLPFLINLAPKEKLKGKKGQNNYSFLKSAFDYATNNQNLLPQTFSFTDWQADIEAYDALMPVLQLINQLQEALADTLFALRTEAQTAALQFLQLAIIASKSNTPGTTDMVADLKSKLGKPYKKRVKKVAD